MRLHVRVVCISLALFLGGTGVQAGSVKVTPEMKVRLMGETTPFAQEKAAPKGEVPRNVPDVGRSAGEGKGESTTPAISEGRQHLFLYGLGFALFVFVAVIGYLRRKQNLSEVGLEKEEW